MTRGIIGWPVYTDLATVDAWGGSWQAAYPVTNLNRLPVRQVARSTGLTPATTRFRVTLPEISPVRLLSFVYFNATNGACFRLRGYADLAMADQRFDTGPGRDGFGVEFWTRIDRTKDIAWRDKRWWSGKPGALEKAINRPSRCVLLDRSVYARVISCEIYDPLNPAGYVQVGYFDVADAIELEANPDYGASFGRRDRNRRTEADGGGQSIEELPGPRSFNGQVPYMPERSARRFGRFQAERSTARPFMWLPTPGDPKTWLEGAFLARNALTNPRKAAALGHESVYLDFEEVI
jgi:hypothetical protein